MSRLLLQAQTFYRYHIKGRYRWWQAEKVLRTDQLPVLVYTMAKVGSMSLSYSIQQHTNYPVFHIHSMRASQIKEAYQLCRQKGWWPDSRQTGALIHQQIIQQNKAVKIICSIREPIARNISAFFEVLPFYTQNQQLGKQPVQTLSRIFMDQLNHDYPLNWMDNELLACLGIKVYDYAFDFNQKYLIIQKDNIELLLMRLDLPDADKSSVLAQFLSCPNFQLMNQNIGSTKKYASLYRDFKHQVDLPASYIQRLLTARYTQHFFSETERKAMYKQWKKS